MRLQAKSRWHAARAPAWFLTGQTTTRIPQPCVCVHAQRAHAVGMLLGKPDKGRRSIVLCSTFYGTNWLEVKPICPLMFWKPKDDALSLVRAAQRLQTEERRGPFETTGAIAGSACCTTAKLPARGPIPSARMDPGRGFRRRRATTQFRATPKRPLEGHRGCPIETTGETARIGARPRPRSLIEQPRKGPWHRP